mgnify:CR=1 FL=1
MDDRSYWVGLNLVKGIGAVRFKQLLEFFGSAEIAWQAPQSAWSSAGIPQRVVNNFSQVKQQVDLERVMEKIGMRREGYLRQNIFFRRDENGNPSWQDSYAYGMLKDDFKKQ